MLAALLIELLIGWPDWVYKRIKHPVVWMGSLISLMDRWLNGAQKSDRERRLGGLVTTLVVVTFSTCIAYAIHALLPANTAGFIIEAIIVASLLASRSLYEHVNAVAAPLSESNMQKAREALSHIVGRDTTSLEESGIAGAAIESLAENSSDGVFAPLFWGLIFGLPGITAYKAINTLDSMIGHRSEKYQAFGYVAAKLDDVVNLIPARLSALLIAIAGGSVHKLMAISQDAKKHRSPNAGWPEGAMAYALRVRLSGPRTYDDVVTHEPWINEHSPLPNAAALARSLHIYKRALMLTVVLMVFVWAMGLVV